MTTLILGATDDPHVNAIYTRLISGRHKAVMIDAYADISALKYATEKDRMVLHYGNDSEAKITGVYWRHSAHRKEPEKIMTIKELCYYQDISTFLFGLDAIYQMTLVNPMETTARMENKIIQLSLALQSGLLVPDTMITGNKNHMAEFAKNNPNELVEKFLGLAWQDNQEPSETHILDIETSQASGYFPTIVQQRIHRETELRIYVIGNTVIPVEICIAKTYQHQLDWRSVNYHARKYQLTSLPEALASALLFFHQQANLIYAAYDIIIDNQGRAYFLECNPTGNWAFLPKNISDQIADAICTVLIKNKEITDVTQIPAATCREHPTA